MLLQGGQVDGLAVLGQDGAVHVVAVGHGLFSLGQDIGHALFQIQRDLAAGDGDGANQGPAGGGQLIEVGGGDAAPAVGNFPGAEAAAVGVAVDLVLGLGAPGDENLGAARTDRGLFVVVLEVLEVAGVDLGNDLAVLGDGGDAVDDLGRDVIREGRGGVGLPAQEVEVLQILGGQVQAIEGIHAVAEHIGIAPVGHAGHQRAQKRLVGGDQVADAVGHELHDLALGAAGGVVEVGVPVGEGDILVQVAQGLSAHGDAGLVEVLDQLAGLIAGTGLVDVQVDEGQVGQGLVKLLNSLLQGAGPDVGVLVHQVGLIEPVPVLHQRAAGDDAAHIGQHGVEAVQGELGGIGMDAVLDAVLQAHINQGVELIRAALLETDKVVVAVGVVVAAGLVALVHDLHTEAVGQIAQGLGLVQDPQEGLRRLAGHVHGNEHPLVLDGLPAIGLAHNGAVGHGGVLPGDLAVGVLVAAHHNGDIGQLVLFGQEAVIVLPSPGGAVEGHQRRAGGSQLQLVLGRAVLSVVLHRGGRAGGDVIEHGVGKALIGGVLRRALGGHKEVRGGAPAVGHAQGRARAETRQGHHRVVGKLEGPDLAGGLLHVGDFQLQRLAGDSQHHGEGGFHAVAGGRDFIGGGIRRAGNQLGSGRAGHKVVAVLHGVGHIGRGVDENVGILFAHNGAVGQHAAGEILIGVDIGEALAHLYLHLVGFQGDTGAFRRLRQLRGGELVHHFHGTGVEGTGLSQIQADLALAGEDAVQCAQGADGGIGVLRAGSGADGQGIDTVGLVQPVGPGGVGRGRGNVVGREIDGVNGVAVLHAAGDPLGAVIPDGGVVLRILVVEDQAELGRGSGQLHGVGGSIGGRRRLVHKHTGGRSRDLGAAAGGEAGNGLTGRDLGVRIGGNTSHHGIVLIDSGHQVQGGLIVEVQGLDQLAVGVILLDVVEGHRDTRAAAQTDGKLALAGVAAGDGVGAHGEPLVAAAFAVPLGLDGDIGAAVLQTHLIGGVGRQLQIIGQTGVLPAGQTRGIVTGPGRAGGVDGHTGVLALVHVSGQEAQGAGHGVAQAEGDLVGAVGHLVKILELHPVVVAGGHGHRVAAHAPVFLVDVGGDTVGEGRSVLEVLRIRIVAALGHHSGQAGVHGEIRSLVGQRRNNQRLLVGGDIVRTGQRQGHGEDIRAVGPVGIVLGAVDGGGEFTVDRIGHAVAQSQAVQDRLDRSPGSLGRCHSLGRDGGKGGALHGGLGSSQHLVGVHLGHAAVGVDHGQGRLVVDQGVVLIGAGFIGHSNRVVEIDGLDHLAVGVILHDVVHQDRAAAGVARADPQGQAARLGVEAAGHGLLIAHGDEVLIFGSHVGKAELVVRVGHTNPKLCARRQRRCIGDRVIAAGVDSPAVVGSPVGSTTGSVQIQGQAGILVLSGIAGQNTHVAGDLVAVVLRDLEGQLIAAVRQGIKLGQLDTNVAVGRNLQRLAADGPVGFPAVGQNRGQQAHQQNGDQQETQQPQKTFVLFHAFVPPISNLFPFPRLAPAGLSSAPFPVVLVASA